MEPLTEVEIRRLADAWYRKLDQHAPVEEVLPLLAQDGFEIRVPEGTFRGAEGFKRLYEEGWISNYFDELHTLKQVTLISAGNKAEVKVVVNWQARAWKPPAPKSEQIDMDAYQTWVVERSSDAGQPVILSYVLDASKPMSGPVDT